MPTTRLLDPYNHPTSSMPCTFPGVRWVSKHLRGRDKGTGSGLRHGLLVALVSTFTRASTSAPPQRIDLCVGRRWESIIPSRRCSGRKCQSRRGGSRLFRPPVHWARFAHVKHRHCRVLLSGERDFQACLSGTRQLRGGSAPPLRPAFKRRVKPQPRSLQKRELDSGEVSRSHRAIMDSRSHSNRTRAPVITNAAGVSGIQVKGGGLRPQAGAAEGSAPGARKRNARMHESGPM